MEGSELSGTIGPYTILGVLGEGGMGVVYRAEQHEPVHREVALKVLRPDPHSEHVVERFEAERQALAVMDHPSIAKIYDAGVTEDGRSYFAMELVSGASLTEFCDAQRLTVRERLRLFVEICNAVQHAHQKGIIHRDLKPSNILVSDVDGRPLPHIIDFGIAKAVQADAVDGTGLTQHGQPLGTPAYMSPEQINGSADVDTRTDIFSLGVILFELLTGALPYDDEAYRGWAAFASQISRDPPSLTRRLGELTELKEAIAEVRKTTPDHLARELKGDVSWIVSRAMEKERDRRYETANAMANDLERVLGHLPIGGPGANTAYLVRKFVRRNRVGVGFAATVVVGLIAVSAVTAVQAERVARARDEAERRRDQAEGLIDFMLTDLREKLEPIGRLEILDDVGQQALGYFASLPESEYTDDELLSRSQALYQIGSVRLNQGDLAEAEDAFAESLRLARELTEREPANPDWLFGQSQSHFWVGYAAWLQDDLETAESEFLGYLDIAETLVAMDSTNGDWRLELGYAHSNLGSVREEREDLEGALEAFLLNLEVTEGLAGDNPESTGLRVDLAVAQNKVGVIYDKLGNLAEARRYYEANLAVTSELASRDSTNASWMDALGLSHYYMGQVARLQGRAEEALAHHLSNRGVFETLSRLDPDNIEWASSLALADLNVGWVLLGLEEWSDGEERLEASRRSFAVLAGQEPGRAEFARRSAHATTLIGMSHLARGRAEEALERARSAREQLQALLASRPGDRLSRLFLGEARLLEGDALAERGESEAAAEAWTSALEDTADGAQADILDLRARGLLRLNREEEADLTLADLAARGYSSPDLSAAVLRYRGRG